MRIEGICAASVRFGFSSARETLRAAATLAAPAQHPEQVPWVRGARKRVSGALREELRAFSVLFTPTAETFPMLWESDSSRDFASDLRCLRVTPGAYRDAILLRLAKRTSIDTAALRGLRRASWYRAAIARRAGDPPSSRAMLDEFATSVTASHARFCAFLDQFHRSVVEPVWEPIERRLRGEVDAAEARLRSHGVFALLKTVLPPGVVVRKTSDGASVVFSGPDLTLPLSPGSTLNVVPSFFTRPGVEAFALSVDGALDCRLVYPISGLAARSIKIARPRLARLLAAAAHPTRLRILELLIERDLSTRELAGFLRLPEPGVSRHLARLVRAGFLQKYRTGYYVLYAIAPDVMREMANAVLTLAPS